MKILLLTLYGTIAAFIATRANPALYRTSTGVLRNRAIV
jgi:hypothetical protein